MSNPFKPWDKKPKRKRITRVITYKGKTYHNTLGANSKRLADELAAEARKNGKKALVRKIKAQDYAIYTRIPPQLRKF